MTKDNLELVKCIIRTKLELQAANKNFEIANGDLIDYYIYQIKANQAKLDYLIKKVKARGISLDLIKQLEVLAKEVS